MDDDWKTEGNPGLTKAKEAAEGAEGYLAIPRFSSNRGDKDTDFNDLQRLVGPEVVRADIANAEKENNNDIFLQHIFIHRFILIDLFYFIFLKIEVWHGICFIHVGFEKQCLT